MITFINGIEANEIVVVGVKGDISQNISSTGYTALESVGF